ncbi:MAG: Gfo/Idh/MocA family oxidoreductase, partial [Armatimonadetes bacterium]|nr:Gfo/Idh/MocA family oxidoreductase [Armatimonadota bacterium]
DGRIGRVFAVYTEMNWSRIESWHADPEGFYQPGAGPLLDVGVYPLTLITTLLGPIRRVTGFAGITLPERLIERGPRAGQTFPVRTPDLVVGGLEFASGVLGRITASFVLYGTKQMSGTELHGEHGSLFISSNHDFHASVEHLDEATREWQPVPCVAPPYKGVDWGRAIFELSDVLRRGAPQRVTGRQALHVLEVCLGILQSAQEGHPVEVTSRFDPPAPVE